eukprot:g2866.t1
MGIVDHVLIPSVWLPLRFICGLGCGFRPSTNRTDDSGDFDTDSKFDEEDEDIVPGPQQQHYMNYEFEQSLRSPTGLGGESGVSFRRLCLSRASSRQRYTSPPSPNADTIEVDVLTKPSAFAFHTVPNTSLFCSRDDSEIAVRSVLYENEQDQLFSDIDNEHLHANVAYLLPKYSCDDMEIGMFTQKKTPLRHMGSALVYRREISQPESTSSFASRSLDVSQSMKLADVNERNKIIRLESLVGAVHRRSDSRTEFGVMGVEGYVYQESELSSSLMGTKATGKALVKSFPIKIPSKSSDHSMESYEERVLEDSARGFNGRESFSRLCSSSSQLRCSSSHSFLKFRIPSRDYDQTGAMNPHYECSYELYSLESEVPLLHESIPSVKFDGNIETISENKPLVELPSDAKPRIVRKNGNRDFLVERLLLADASTVN